MAAEISRKYRANIVYKNSAFFLCFTLYLICTTPKNRLTFAPSNDNKGSARADPEAHISGAVARLRRMSTATRRATHYHLFIINTKGTGATAQTEPRPFEKIKTK